MLDRSSEFRGACCLGLEFPTFSATICTSFTASATLRTSFAASTSSSCVQLMGPVVSLLSNMRKWNKDAVSQWELHVVH